MAVILTALAVLCVAAALAGLYALVWRRARLRFTITRDAVLLHTRIVAVVPLSVTIAAGSVEDVRYPATWRDVREVAAQSGFLTWPVAFGTPDHDMVLVRRSRGVFRVVIAYTDRASELVAALEQMRARDQPDIRADDAGPSPAS